MAPVSPSPGDEDFSNYKRTSATDLSTLEEGKVTPSVVASSPIITVSSINAHKIIAELVGTFIIIFIGCGSMITGSSYPFTVLGIGVAVAWGLTVMVMIYSLGHVSGGHFNPAITIAFVVSYKFPWRQMVGYVGAQLTGSILAILTLKVMCNDEKYSTKLTTTDFEGEATPLQAFFWEFILSFILMLSICGVATDDRAVTELSGVAVGATMIINMIVAGSITGASMNPARSLGPALVMGKLHGLWVYITAPILGMIAASSMYSFLWLHNSHQNKHHHTNNIAAGRDGEP